MRYRFVSMFVVFALGACVPEATRPDLPELDRRVTEAHPEFSHRIATRIGRPDAQGLIGRNRQWGVLHSVRFQFGAGRTLRLALALADDELIAGGTAALNAGLASREPDGAFPISLPPELADEVRPGLADQASAAAFFLSDVCPALVVAGADPDQLAAIVPAMDWLSHHTARLMERDRHAPNRLLITARAFVGCGQLLDDPELVSRADPFVELALDSIRSDGVFVETGGSDTSYQGVALVAALDILALGYSGAEADRLAEVWQRGALWLADQIDTEGRLDSSRNTRTCGTEVFLGRPKDVDLPEVFWALANAEVVLGDQIPELTRFKAWLETRPNSCVPSR